MSYIFVTGAPGSKWSSVAKNIYYSPDVNQSDYREEWTYFKHDQVMHLGAYFDPGMECALPEDLSTLSRTELESIFDTPFTNKQGKQIIKSHIFSENIDYLKQTFPEVPIILVYRNNDSCLGWWIKAGGFDIAYPNYRDYYVDIPTMIKIIERQNHGIQQSLLTYPSTLVHNNVELCEHLGIGYPPKTYRQDYQAHDIIVNLL